MSNCCFISGEKRTASTSAIRSEKGIGLPPYLAGSSPCNLIPFPTGTMPDLHVALICSFPVPTVISPSCTPRVLKEEQGWLKFCNYTTENSSLSAVRSISHLKKSKLNPSLTLFFVGWDLGIFWQSFRMKKL